MKRPTVWLPAAVLAAASVTLGAPAAHADGTVSIRTHLGKCLDVKSASNLDDAAIVQYRCNGQDNQRFRLRWIGHGRVVIHTFAGKCLDVKQASPADGAAIIQYHCNGHANQHFRVGPLHILGPISTFTNKCATVKGPADDLPVVQTACSGLPTQLFAIL